MTYTNREFFATIKTTPTLMRTLFFFTMFLAAFAFMLSTASATIAPPPAGGGTNNGDGPYILPLPPGTNPGTPPDIEYMPPKPGNNGGTTDDEYIPMLPPGPTGPGKDNPDEEEDEAQQEEHPNLKGPYPPPGPCPKEEDSNSDDSDDTCYDCQSSSPQRSPGQTSAQNKCVFVGISFGSFPNNPDFPAGKLRIESKKMNPLLYTPAIVRYDHPTMRRIVGKETVSSQPQITIRYNGIYTVVYRIGTDGIGSPVGESSQWKSAFRMLDAQENVIASGTPTYYEEISSTDRSIIRYSVATGKVVAMKMPNSPWVEVSALELNVLYADGSIRQIYNNADGLINISAVSDSSFRIDWYKHADVIAPTGGEIYYSMNGNPIKSWIFSNPSPNAKSNKQFHMLEKRGNFEFEYLWIYFDQLNDWLLRRGAGPDAVEEYKQLVKRDNIREEIIMLRSTAGQVAKRTKKIYRTFIYGELLISAIEDFGGANRTTTYEYDNNANLTKTIFPTGLTITRAYDSMRRLTKETRGTVYGNEVTDYTYESNEDFRPKTKTLSVGGTILSKTDYSYFEVKKDRVYFIRTEGGTSGSSYSGVSEVLENIVTEITTSGGNTQRTMTRYNSSTVSGLAAGRVKSITMPNDITQAYTYETLPNNGLRVIMTMMSNISVVPGKSTRTVSDYNAFGELVRQEEWVHTGSDFERISWVNHTYSPAHKIIRSEYSDGTSFSADYICKGPVWTVGRDGIRTEYFYDTAKRRYKTVRHSPHGTLTSTKRFDAAGRTISETVSSGDLSQTVSAEYDRLARPTKQTNAAGLVTTYTYSADGRIITATNPAGGTEITEFNADITLRSVTGTAVTPKYYTYYVQDGLRMIKETTATPTSPRWKSLGVNDFGQAVREEQSGFEGAVIRTDNTYRADQLASVQTTGKPKATYEYDLMGNRSKLTVTAGDTARIQETTTDFISENGAIWKRTKDVVKSSDATIAPLTTSRKVQLSGLSNAVQAKEIAVDERGNASTVWSTFNPTEMKTVSYQKLAAFGAPAERIVIDGRPVSETDVYGATTTYTYDSLGRPASKTDRRGNTTTYAYNDKGQAWRTVDAAGASTEYSYDNAGRLTAIKDAMGKYTRYGYDVKGQKTAEYGDNVYPVMFEYNEYGETAAYYTFRAPGSNLTAQPATAQGDRTSYAYDEASGLLVSKTFANGTATRYNYNAKGELTRRIWARGVTTDYTYDPFGKIVSANYSDSTPAVSGYYDALGRGKSVTDAKGASTLTYGAYGNVVTETISGAYEKTLTRHYDNIGRNVGYSVDGIRQATYKYGASSGWLTGMDIGNNREFSFGYFGSSVIYPNGMEQSVEYETKKDNIASVTHTNGATQISKYAYTNDLLGRRLQLNATVGGVTKRIDYGYNDRSEVISAQQPNNSAYDFAFAYDNIGNRESATENGISKAYQANALNQYTSIDGFMPTFDADGNQTTVKTATGIWTVDYNAENRPIRFVQGNMEISMEYDYEGRRFEKIVKVDGTIQNHQKFLYSEYLQIAELDANDATVKSYVWDPTNTVNTRPLSVTANGNTHYYIHDANKNVVGLLAEDGTATARYEYTPFGAVSTQTGLLASTSPFLFSSEYFDAELALNYYNYRHYDPADGRWLSRDPIEEFGGFNLYGMLANNPIFSIDHLGQGGSNPQDPNGIYLDGKLVGRITPDKDNCLSVAIGDDRGALSPNYGVPFEDFLKALGITCTAAPPTRNPVTNGLDYPKCEAKDPCYEAIILYFTGLLPGDKISLSDEYYGTCGWHVVKAGDDGFTHIPGPRPKGTKPKPPYKTEIELWRDMPEKTIPHQRFCCTKKKSG